MFFNLNFKNIGSMFADNSNLVNVSKFNTLNLKIGKEFNLFKSTVYPFLILLAPIFFTKFRLTT